jgi:hypothetical protein
LRRRALANFDRRLLPASDHAAACSNLGSVNRSSRAMIAQAIRAIDSVEKVGMLMRSKFFSLVGTFF